MYGGLGAILSQINEHNAKRLLSYTSRKLQVHEQNYTSFI
jgi:hypothetical protein